MDLEGQPILVNFEFPHRKHNHEQKDPFFRTAGIWSAIKLLDRAKIVEMSRKSGEEAWIEVLRIIDSTTIVLFSNVFFKDVGRHP